MTKLLIVEDDSNKREQLNRLVNERFPLFTVSNAESLMGGVRALRRWRPEIVVLDMTLPNYDPEDEGDTGETEGFGGEEFLRQAVRFGLSPVVIVVTQFEIFSEYGESKDRAELHAHLNEVFPTIYRNMVYYHASLNSWADELEQRLTDALEEIKS